MARAVILAADDAQRRPAPRRGLSCAEAADYVGISISKFLEMVEDGRMPKAKHIDKRRVWDIRKLDLAFDEIDGDEDAGTTGEGSLPGKKKIVL